jgi:CBS domain containing-hemolysin-like protein
VPLALFYVLFYPVTKFTISITNVLLKNFLKTDVKKSSKDLVFGRIDLDEFVNENDTTGADKKTSLETEVKLFKNALDFSKVKLREIMVPRTEIEMLDIHAPVNDLRQKFVETGHSRILIFNENVDNIVGYVHSFFKTLPPYRRTFNRC